MRRFTTLKKGVRHTAALQHEDGYTRQPLFVGGMDGVLITPAEGSGAVAWTEVHKSLITQLVSEQGAVLLRGLPVTTPTEFAEVFETLFGPTFAYSHRMTERSEVAARNVYTSTDYPPAQMLPMHHEYSYQRRIIERIAFYCVKPSEVGGATPLCDGFAVYDAVPREVRDALEKRDVLYVRNTGSPVTLSWQETYQTDLRERVEEYCRTENINFRWRQDGELQTTVRRRAFLDHPHFNTRILCNHIPLLHKLVAYTPALFERFFTGVDPLDLPYHVLYGDGGEIPDAHIRAIADAYTQHANRFSWQAGDVLLLDNLRVAHGRDMFAGERLLNVVMAGLHDRGSVE